MIFSKRDDVSSLDIISSDLQFLRHRGAASTVLELLSKINSSIIDAKNGSIGFEVFDSSYLSWQKNIRSLKPNYWQLIQLWGGL